MQSFFPLIFAASAYLHLSAASPLYPDASVVNLNSRATYNCTDTAASPSTLCWDELDIADYLARWNRTTPTCRETGGSSGADCCHSQEPWTTCFLRLSYGSKGTQCTTINPQACVLIALSPNLGSGIAPMVGYVVRNIVEINYLFTSYYYSLAGQGLNVTGSNSTSAKLQQSMKTGATLNNGDIVKTFLAGLPFWGTPTVLAGGPQQIQPNINNATSEAFLQSLQNTHAVGSILFGASNDSSQSLAVGSDLTQNLTEAGVRLQSALDLIMSDMPTFTAWAAHGLYSGPSAALSVPPVAVGITSAFDTYLIGQVLSQSHFSATPGSTTVTKEDFQQSRTCTTLGDVCQDSDGKTYYRSPAYQWQYEINEPKKWASGSAGQQLGYDASAYGLLQYIETTDAYLPVLFDGAYNCTLQGKAGGSAVLLNTDHSLNVACLSSLPIYLSKGSSCPRGAVQVGGKCPFGFNG